MGNLKQALHMERSRLFVGRKEEQAHVRHWLEQPEAPTQAIYVSGMGGIGKTALLLKFLDMADDSDALCIWLDGRACQPSPSGFLDAMHSYLFGRMRSDSAAGLPAEDLIDAVSRRRTLLCIDNYDDLNKIEGWLREAFFPELPAAGVLIALAGRQQVTLDWHNDIAWRGRLKTMRLEPLTRSEAISYYANFDIRNNGVVETLIQETQGYPLAMALAADQVNKKTPDSLDGGWPLSHLVSARLLREVASPDLHDILDVLSILPQANQELLRRLLSTPLTMRQLHMLTQLSFVRPTSEGFALHDVARVHLLDDFQRREPARYQEIRRRIVEEACRSLRVASPPDRNRIAAALLTICRDALPQGAFPLNPAAAAFDAYREGDLPHLHRILDEEQSQKAIYLESETKAHELLDELTQLFPGSIRLYRAESGIPVMFHAGLLLYSGTFRFLQRYMPGILEACLAKETGPIAELDHAEADTYYHFLGGSDHHHPMHAPAELYELMFADGFASIISMGIRFLLTPNNDVVNFRFQALGCVPRKFSMPEASYLPREGIVLELDLRVRDFGDWVSSFLDTAKGADQQNAKPALTAADVKYVFQSLRDAERLGRSSAARCLNCTGDKLQAKLRSLLSADPPPAPLSRRHQHILQLLSQHPSLSPETTANRLHISRATYYRHLREAIDISLQLLTGAHGDQGI